MLKLKKLQILGFKSFCDRTELKFHGDGIAAIVGPNGCGKSNISDAISWVLGEQSAKTLRGARMEDVIFAGTRDRKPTGMAEVSLTLIDPEAYDGPDAEAELEVDVQDEMTASPEDWDEAAERAAALEEAERIAAELQPGRAGEVPAEASAQASPAEASTDTAPQTNGAPLDVVLKIRRRRLKPQAVRKGEIVVTRRLFRSGDSEYLLNGRICRLRDIQELFMGTGLGPESYAIIEQGRIGQILSSKPHDRRAIIEEAAGITKFKTKKRLAEARLEEARLNLARVNDIFEEVTRQMNSLKRQASKAERYSRLRDEMRARLRIVLASKFRQMERENAHIESQLEAVAEQMRAEGERVAQLEAEQYERQQRGYALEQESRHHHDRLNAVLVETDRANARRQHNQERCAEMAARSAAAEAELAQAVAHLAALEGEREANRAVLESAAADVAAAQQEAALRQQQAQAAAADLDRVEREQEARRADILDAIAGSSLVRNQITQEQERLAALDREAQRVGQELAAAQESSSAFGGRRGQLAFEFETISGRLHALSARIAANRALVEEKKAAEADAKKRLDGLRAEYAAALGRKASLEALIAEHGYSTESVRRLFQSNLGNSGFAPVGVLADFLEVEDQYEHVVEDFLRDELNYVVVKSWNSADEGLRLLRSDVDGRATFLVHPEDAQARFSFAVDENAKPASFQGSLVPLKHCIRVLNGFGKSLEVILPKLRDGYIAPDPSTARELALENPDAFFLSRSGECFHNVTVTGGRQRAEGPLSMKRELRDLLRQIGELEHALRSQEATVGTLAREIKELGALLDNLEDERRLVEKQALASESGLQQLDAELARLQERLATHQRELERLAAERAEKQAAAAILAQELGAREQLRAQLEQAAAAAQESLAGLRATRDRAAAEASERMARLAALDERRIAAAAALQRIETLAVEASARVGTLRGQIEAARAETEQRTAENTQLAETLAALAREQEAARAREAELQLESEQLRARLAAIEQELRSARAALDDARDRRGELSTILARLQSDAQHMAETCLNELNLPREQLLAESQDEPLQGQALEQEETLYREMRSRLDAMGPVNMMALEEYQETAQRHAFLETQRKDLLDSIENTQNTIREIDTISREKFQEAFARINENFHLTFRKLFGGGQAFMRLTDEENTAESGIDVVASPPGKKLQNVLLLSGGEKALTALALLVGIFQYQPSPFCVLDEVDAPLDEANVGRFTELVREMSAQTQFVLITHSKKTMSMAPVMYGVTMQEPGVSKLVSVRFGAEAARD